MTTENTDSTVTETTDNQTTEWPTASLGSGAEQTDWTEGEINAFAETFANRLVSITEDQTLDATTGPAAVHALINEATEATNIPVGVINGFVNQILQPVDPIAQLAQILGMDRSEIQNIVGG